MADAHANLTLTTVATAPSPATSGTSLVVASGKGANLPAAPFNATIWPSASQPTLGNAEIVRVTAVSTDTLTITRAQEGTSARTVVVGDQIAATVTAKTLTDVETVAAAAVPKSTVTTKGDLIVASGSAAVARLAVGSDTQVLTADAASTNGVKWAAASGSSWTATVTKASDESVSSSTTLQNDDELFFSTVSGSAYAFELLAVYGSPAGGTTPDMFFDLGEDATARGLAIYLLFDSTDSTITGVIGTNQTLGSCGTATGDRLLRVSGTHTGGGGTFRFRWAQKNSGANATIVRAGSILRYQKLT